MEKTKGNIEPNIYDGDPLTDRESTSTAAQINKSYYDYEKYVSKTRILTYHYQVTEVLKASPTDLLEIGIGSKVVASILRGFDLPVTTVDINPELKPDILGSVTDLKSIIEPKSYDWILCARVLHHLSFVEFETAIKELAATAKTGVILTLPVEDMRLYLGLRKTAGQYKIFSVPFPLFVKNLLYKVMKGAEERYKLLWKIGSHADTKLDRIEEIISRYFTISDGYAIPEDRSHYLFVLNVK